MPKMLAEHFLFLAAVLTLTVARASSVAVEMLEVTGSISLDSSVCSQVTNVSGSQTPPRSVIECVLECGGAECAAAAWFSADSRCQLLTFSDSGSSGCLTSRLLQAAPPAVQVFKKPDLSTRILSASGFMAFSVTGSGANGAIQVARIGTAGCYRVEARGARGGSTWSGFNPVTRGGFGATVAADFNLPAGLNLSVVVGQRGGDASQANDGAGGGGGGGSFVYLANDTLLLAAGGGGGAGRAYTGISGQAGLNGTNSYTGDWPQNNGLGGTNGQPGEWVDPTVSQGLRGGPGAGWLAAAPARTNTAYGQRGGGRVQGWVGGIGGAANTGAVGGFGGGGGGGPALGAGGGAGGYSGGGAGTYYKVTGGGGGSYCGGFGCVAVTGGNSGSDNGFVIFKLISTGAC